MGKFESRLKRKKRVRSKVFGTIERPRLSVYRSNKFIYAQLVDDGKKKTLLSASDLELKSKKEAGTKTQKAYLVGEMISKKAKLKKITKIVFDRGGYRYHGRVKALADGARKGGLDF